MATKRNKTRNTLTPSPKIRTSASRTEVGRDKNETRGNSHLKSDREIDYEGKGRPNRNAHSRVSHGYESEKSPVTRWGQGNADEGEYESQGFLHLVHDDLDEERIQKKKNKR